MNIGGSYLSSLMQNYLRKNNQGLEKAMERLASGKRINSPADDPAGFAIATRMESKIRGMEVGLRNSNDAISMLQTGESAMGSIANILQRMRELAVQSANGTNTSTDRSSLNKEFNELSKEIAHISSATNFNGNPLLNAAGVVNIQLSDVLNDTMGISTFDVTSTSLIGDFQIDTAENAQLTLDKLDDSINVIANNRASFGAYISRLGYNIDNITSMKINLENAVSRIMDADMAKEVSEMAKYKILTQSSMAMLSQANQMPQMLLKLLE